MAEPVSELTTNRLSVYLRCLSALDAAGVRTISSQGLAEQFKLNAAQIRKDLAYFGEFGVRGIGYYVKELRRHLRQILGWTAGSASGSSAPATSASPSPTMPDSEKTASRSSRCSTRSRKRSGAGRAAASHPRHQDFKKVASARTSASR